MKLFVGIGIFLVKISYRGEKMKYLIGIDIGTSGTKTALFDVEGGLVSVATVEYPLYQPKNGWAEQNPEDWWNAVCQSCRQVISESKINALDIQGIGLSGQMHGLVMLDKKGNVLRPAIIWCDQRTDRECDIITEKVGERKLIEITGNPALTGFTASKILWVKNNQPEIYSQCKHILLPKDYIRYKLTGEFATEVSDASGMQVFDIKNRKWSSEILSKLDIDESLFGKVYNSPEITGTITEEAARLTFLPKGTAVVGGAGDNAATAIGTGVVQDGRAFTTIGTSGVVYAHTSKLLIDPMSRIHTFCSAVPGEWHVMGVTQAAGLSLQWFRNNFCIEEMLQAEEEGVDPYTIMDKKALEIPIGAENLIYLPYLMGERTPHLDPYARGVFFGLSGMHTRDHLIRAVLEGVAYSLTDCFEIIREMGINIDNMMLSGGGGKSLIWPQMLADLFRCLVNTIESQHGAALGVAILAGVGTGVYGSIVEACNILVKGKNINNPNYENSNIYDGYHQIYKKLYNDLNETFAILSKGQ